MCENINIWQKETNLQPITLSHIPFYLFKNYHNFFIKKNLKSFLPHHIPYNWCNESKQRKWKPNKKAPSLFECAKTGQYCQKLPGEKRVFSLTFLSQPLFKTSNFGASLTKQHTHQRGESIMVSVCFVCELPILSHQAWDTWTKGPGIGPNATNVNDIFHEDCLHCCICMTRLKQVCNLISINNTDISLTIVQFRKSCNDVSLKARWQNYAQCWGGLLY